MLRHRSQKIDFDIVVGWLLDERDVGKLIAGWLLEELVVRELVVGWLLEELVRCGGARRRLANGGAQCQNDASMGGSKSIFCERCRSISFDHMRSHEIACDRMRSHEIACDRMRSHEIICNCMQSHEIANLMSTTTVRVLLRRPPV